MTSRERRWLALLTLLSLALFAALGGWARFVPTQAWEKDLVFQLALGQGAFADSVRTLNGLGNPVNWLSLTLIVAVLAGLRRGVAAALVVLASYLVDLPTVLAKILVERGRPETDAAQLLFGNDAFGFPSGHVARAAALAGVVGWLLLPARWRLIGSIVSAVFAGAVMAYARIALGVHYPIDTFGGLALGLAWMTLSVLVAASVSGRGSAAD